MGRGAVILLQADGGDARKVARVGLHVGDARAAPAVDRLVVVADRKHLAAAACQHADPGVLNAVGILKFIDQDVLKFFIVVFARRSGKF